GGLPRLDRFSAGMFFVAVFDVALFAATFLAMALFTGAGFVAADTFDGRPRFAFTATSTTPADSLLSLAQRALCASAMRLRTAALLLPRVFFAGATVALSGLP